MLQPPAFLLFTHLTCDHGSVSGWLPISPSPTPPIGVLHTNSSHTSFRPSPVVAFCHHCISAFRKKQKGKKILPLSWTLRTFPTFVLTALSGHLLLYSPRSGDAVGPCVSEYLVFSPTCWANFKLASQLSC